MIEDTVVRGLPTGLAFLRDWRLANGYSQTRLGELAGVRQATIADLERGLYMPRPSTVRKLAQALGITPMQLATTSPMDEARRVQAATMARMARMASAL